MSTISEITDSLRRELGAELRAQRADAFRRVAGVRREVKELRAEHEAYHVETTRGLAAIGDQFAALERNVETKIDAIVESIAPLAAAHAARARRRARVKHLAKQAVTTAPGLIGIATSIAAAAAAVIGVL